MDQLAYSLLALNVDGQQRLPFQPRSALDVPFNAPIRSVIAHEFIPTYPVKNTAPFSLAPMTFKEPPNCQPASANQPTNPQMEVEEEDEMMLPADAAAAPAKLQTSVRRSERLANKPRLNYKESIINKE